MNTDNEVLVRVQDLVMHFPIYRGVIRRQVGAVRAVDGVSLEIRKGETLGLVGESGCGKTTVGRTILQLYKPTSGHVYFSLKDANAQVRCVMWRNRTQLLGWRLENGQMIEARALVSFYEPRGEFQLNVESNGQPISFFCRGLFFLLRLQKFRRFLPICFSTCRIANLFF